MQAVPSGVMCTTGNKVVTFAPGIYTDATAMNNLFGDPNCKSATFLFPPHKNGAGQYDSTGLYYFNFQNTRHDLDPLRTGDHSSSASSRRCRRTTGTSGASRRGADYSGQHVVGGRPFGWDPNADHPQRSAPHPR